MTTADKLNLLTQSCDARFDMNVPAEMKKQVIKTSKKKGYASWATWVRTAIVEKLERDNAPK